MIIISDALHVEHDNSGNLTTLKPTLPLTPSDYRIEWFHTASRNPLAWYAWLHQCSPTSCLLSDHVLQDDDHQCWLASPFHGQLQGSHFRLLPESKLHWQAADANALCESLNPMLAEEGMRLESIYGFLLLVSNRIMDATLPSLTQLGSCLPNRPPQGNDGLQLMRIMGDIQTQLYQTPLERTVKDAPIIHGLWLHDAVTLPALPMTTSTMIEPPYQVNHVNAPTYAIHIKTTQQCQALHLYPQTILLAGDGVAAMLRQRPAWQRWFTPKHRDWQPHQPSEENMLYQRLHQYAP